VSNAAIGRALGICDDTVRKWRHRFCRHGMGGLCDRPARDDRADSPLR
jgi:transposase-like protein